MEKSFKIAICGKGGVGKTTVCAVWSQLLAQDGLDVLAIDADSNPTLAAAMGIGASDAPKPLIEMKELIEQRTHLSMETGQPYFKLNPVVSDLPEKYLKEINGVKLLVIGGIENAGGGCACPEGAFLKSLLSHTILYRGEVVIVDLAAGVEFMGRACVQGIDGLAVVVEPGKRSIETALHIAKMAKQMKIEHVGAFINKVTDSGQIKVIEEKLQGIEVLGNYHHDTSLQDADLNEASAMEASDELVSALSDAKDKLLNMIEEFSKKM